MIRELSYRLDGEKGEDMKRTVYKVIVNGKQVVKLTNKKLAERTVKSASEGYGLEAEIIEAIEEYEDDVMLDLFLS